MELSLVRRDAQGIGAPGHEPMDHLQGLVLGGNVQRKQPICALDEPGLVPRMRPSTCFDKQGTRTLVLASNLTISIGTEFRLATTCNDSHPYIFLTSSASGHLSTRHWTTSSLQRRVLGSNVQRKISIPILGEQGAGTPVGKELDHLPPVRMDWGRYGFHRLDSLEWVA
jgi:hypothetical protein